MSDLFEFISALSIFVAINQQFREATITDKDDVLSMRKNVYRGMDYLPAYYDYFIHDKTRRCIVGQLDSKIVSFVVLMQIDGGQSLFCQAGRVNKKYEGMGFLSALTQYVKHQYKDEGCENIMFLTDTMQFAKSESFQRTHTEIATKLQYGRIITEDTRAFVTKNIDELILSSSCGFKESQSRDLRKYFASRTIRHVLFPKRRLIVNYIPYRVMNANVSMLNGRNTKFLSNIRQSQCGIMGLLTAGSWYKCNRCTSSYTIDIFGNDIDSLEKHIVIHLSKALNLFPGQFVLNVCVDQGDIAITLCEILTKICGNVEGWLASNSILEDPIY